MAIFEETVEKTATTVAIVSGTSVNGPVVQIKEDNTSIQIDIKKNTGILAGTVKLQTKVIMGNVDDVWQWVDVAGSEQDLNAVADAATDPFVWNIRGYGINYSRVVIVPTDTANITYKIGYGSKI